MKLVKIVALSALMLTSAVLSTTVFAQKSATTKTVKMHKACAMCAKKGMKECSHDMGKMAMGKTKSSKMHKACAMCAKKGMKECSHDMGKMDMKHMDMKKK
jgi:hypothetical protein